MDDQLWKDLIKKLEQNKSAVSAMVTAIDPAQATWKPDQDRWSVVEVINHLADLESEDFRADFSIILTTPEKPWPNYDIFELLNERNYNSRGLSESLNRFISERNTSLSWLESLKKPDLSMKHSGNGKRGDALCLGDILCAWVDHDLYHIKQLAQLHHDILKEFCKPYSPLYSGYEA